MNLKLSYQYRPLFFKVPGGTSRGVLKEKPTWIIKIEDEQGYSGYGEVSLIPGLSTDNISTIDKILPLLEKRIAGDLPTLFDSVKQIPSLLFALEQALLDYKNGGKQILFPSDFTNGKYGIKINGLIWMNPVEVMEKDVNEKINSGFKCIKLKIGAIEMEDELNLLRRIRRKFGNDLVIRVDANGSFDEKNIFQLMDDLEELNIHSIEQPVGVGNFNLMKKVSKHNQVGVALDEELINIQDSLRENLLDEIQPDYLILKPSLHGGLVSCDHWISIGEKRNIKWWATSALESNIGLNAIAQWVFVKYNNLPQGLGTGSLFTNNINSPLEIVDDELRMNPTLKWNLPF